MRRVKQMSRQKQTKQNKQIKWNDQKKLKNELSETKKRIERMRLKRNGTN